ncbi:MAG: PEP-CTERM sorting domain-containing protein [Verrucomicrobiota bacterium]
MKKTASTLALTLLVAVGSISVPSARAQNLLVNGGFDLGFDGWDGTYGLYSGPMNPPALSGNTVADLDGGEPSMFQSFTTVPGVTYQVSWGRRLPDLDGNGIPIIGESFVGPGLLNVNLNGQDIQDLVQNRTTWSFYTVNFVATGTGSLLSFNVSQSIFVGGGFQPSDSVFLDNVSAIAVPEPSVCGLLLIGAAFLVRRQAACR